MVQISQEYSISNKPTDQLSILDVSGMDLTGATDITSLINLRLTDAGTDQTIKFPAGIYGITSDIQPLAGQHLLASGAGGDNINTNTGAIFRALVGASFTEAMIDVAGQCTIEGFKFDGNSIATNAISFKPATNGFRPVVKFCRFDDFLGDVITGQLSGSTGPDSATVCFCEFNGGAPGFGMINIENSSDTNIYECRFIPDLNCDYMIKLKSTLNNHIASIRDCLFEGSNAGIGISGFVDAITIDGDSVTVRGNNFQISPSDINHVAHIHLLTGASSTNIRENNYQTRGTTAVNILIDSGASNTWVDGTTFGWDAANGVSADITDNGLNSLISLGRTIAGQRFFLTPTFSIVAYDGGEQFHFDTATTKLLLGNNININNWMAIVAGVMTINADAFLDLNTQATGKTRIKVGNVIALEGTDDGAAGEVEMRVMDVTGGSLVRVSIGVANSGGTGFRYLRIPN